LICKTAPAICLWPKLRWITPMRQRGSKPPHGGGGVSRPGSSVRANWVSGINNCAISPQFGSKMSEMQVASEKGVSIPTREKPHPWSRESPMSHKSDIEIAREANKKPIWPRQSKSWSRVHQLFAGTQKWQADPCDRD